MMTTSASPVDRFELIAYLIVAACIGFAIGGIVWLASIALGVMPA